MSRRSLLLLLVCFGLAWFSSLDYRKLIHPDEGRYAEIAREMASTGDFVTPRLNNIKYFEKPPLQYWMTAATFTAFGPSQWASRIWPALTGFLGVLLAGWCASRLFGQDTGVAAATVLASNFLYSAIGHINTLDMGVSVLMSTALFLFLLAEQRIDDVSRHRRLVLTAWALLGLAVLSKGLMGMVLPGAVLVLYALFTRQGKLILRARPLVGTGVLLLVTAPWFVAVSIVNPEFPHFFFIHEHVDRFMSTEHRRDGPIWYFVPILLVGMLPWTSHLLLAVTSALQRFWQRTMSTAELGLWLWTGFIFTFFSISHSKLPSYILPIFPTLAILLGQYLSQANRRTLVSHALVVATIGLGLWLLSPLALDLADDAASELLYQTYLPWLQVACLGLLFGGIGAAWCYWRDRIKWGHLALGIAGLLLSTLVLLGHETLSGLSSSYRLAQVLKPRITADSPIYLVNYYDQTLPFYLGRPVTLVNYLDEFEYGLRQEPEKMVEEYDDFIDLWETTPNAIAVMTPHRYDILLEEEQLPMQVIYRDIRRVAVIRPMSKLR